MDLIIGGAFQGKSIYAKEQYPKKKWVLGGEVSEEELLSAQGILEFQKYVRKELKQGHSVKDLAEKIAGENPDAYRL